MKTVKKITMNALQVISEPGDCTRYEYIIILNLERDVFQILSIGYSTMPLPLEISISEAFDLWKEIKDMTNVKEQAEYMQKVMSNLNCNVFTYAEIIRTIGENYEHFLSN